ncbi:MAG: hypothetical protein VKN17_04200, partial [Cyanobacteriota bacterium]|nr:hypothetical protein [Cyanobacteriota bacterium]
MNARKGKLGDFVMTLLVLLIGAGLLYGSIWNRDVGATIADVLAIPLAAGGLGAILILSIVLRWVGSLGKPKDSFIDFESEDGSVGISTKAICDFIERIGKEFAAVKSIDSRLAKTKDGINISLNVKVLSGNKIP